MVNTNAAHLNLYERNLLEELLEGLANGLELPDTRTCLYSESVVQALRIQVRCWRRGSSTLFAQLRKHESDLPDVDLVVFQARLDLVESGSMLTHIEAAEDDPQIWLHLIDYVPCWRSVQQGPVGPNVYYANKAFYVDCVLVSTPIR